MIGENRQQRGLRQSIDWSLIVCYLLLVVIGWVNIYASVHSADSASILDFGLRSGKQFVWILTALGLAGLILFVLPSRVWQGFSVPLYAVTLFLLVLVIFVSKDVKGSHSWFELGPVKFQPAELSKITSSLLLAAVMSQSGFKLQKPKHFAAALAVVFVPMLAILGESETGSALVYLGFIFVLYREGLPGWWLAAIGTVILLFITTLTLSPFSSLLILSGLVALSCMLDGGRLRPGFWANAAFVAAMAFLPKLWAGVTGRVAAAVERAENVYTVTLPGQEETVFWAFLADIHPVHILLGVALPALLWFLWRAYRERNRSLALGVAAFVAGVVLVFSADFIFNDVLQEHQRKRIEVLLGMKEDPSGVGYNVKQSMIAIGSGGAFGKGYLNGTQTTFGFVPEQSTDFIFCTVGEEWGFAGCLVVILLYVFLIARILLDAERSREAFTRIYGYCVAACIFMHLFINVGMTVGLMPVIGIPLPLLSYGGSSLWAFTVMIFIFIALYREEKKYF